MGNNFTLCSVLCIRGYSRSKPFEAKMNEIKFCRNCDFSKPVGEWQLDCTEGMFGSKYMFSQSATPRIFGCTKYRQFKKDKYYQGKHIVVPKKEVTSGK